MLYLLFEQEFSTFWKTSGSDEEVEEEEGREEVEDDVDTDNGKVGFSGGCDWPAAITPLDCIDCNKRINCTYMAPPVRKDRENTNVTMELTTNSNTYTALNFIDFLNGFYAFL